MTISEFINALGAFPPGAHVVINDGMRGPQPPRAFYWTDYYLDGAATDYGYPGDDTVVISA